MKLRGTIIYHCLQIALLCSVPSITTTAQEGRAKAVTEAIKPDSVHKTVTIEDYVVVGPSQILGNKFKARHRTGSAYYLAPDELRRLGHTDINRILGAVPGVNIYEEDGFGLRPNISLRGTKAERSERISIMEDGVLAAPAPYSTPAAYYFPNVARMHAVEVLKGSSQIQYGPFTTGGAINLVSTPIPNKLEGELRASYGMYNSLKGYGKIGGKRDILGTSLNTSATKVTASRSTRQRRRQKDFTATMSSQN